MVTESLSITDVLPNGEQGCSMPISGISYTKTVVTTITGNSHDYKTDVAGAICIPLLKSVDFLNAHTASKYSLIKISNGTGKNRSIGFKNFRIPKNPEKMIDGCEPENSITYTFIADSISHSEEET